MNATPVGFQRFSSQNNNMNLTDFVWTKERKRRRVIKIEKNVSVPGDF